MTLHPQRFRGVTIIPVVVGLKKKKACKKHASHPNFGSRHQSQCVNAAKCNKFHSVSSTSKQAIVLVPNWTCSKPCFTCCKIYPLLICDFLWDCVSPSIKKKKFDCNRSSEILGHTVIILQWSRMNFFFTTYSLSPSLFFFPQHPVTLYVICTYNVLYVVEITMCLAMTGVSTVPYICMYMHV